MRHKIFRSSLLALMLTGMLAVSADAQRTQLKPGVNMFSPQQDVDMGTEASLEVERDQPILTNRQAENYLNSVGQRLASSAPGEKYPYRFKIVNDREINAFALPGGYVYINRGIFETADNEDQLAGVVAHEISHVALRHGTSQVTKAMPLSILGSFLGTRSQAAGILAQVGGTAVLLRNSRDAES